MEFEGRQFPNRLRKHRKMMGYKQVDVARLLSLKNTSRISRWERGLVMPSVLNLIKLSILYRTLMNELYFDVGEEIRTHLVAKEAELFSTLKEKDIFFQ